MGNLCEPSVHHETYVVEEHHRRKRHTNEYGVVVYIEYGHPDYGDYASDYSEEHHDEGYGSGGRDDGYGSGGGGRDDGYGNGDGGRDGGDGYGSGGGGQDGG